MLTLSYIDSNITFFQKEIGVIPNLINQKTKLLVNSLSKHTSVQHIYKVDYNDNSIGFCLHMNIINVQ